MSNFKDIDGSSNQTFGFNSNKDVILNSDTISQNLSVFQSDGATLANIQAGQAINTNDVITKRAGVSPLGIVIGTSTPTIIDGTVFWYNTTFNEIFYRDLVRDKWLSMSVVTLTYGEDGADGILLGGPGMSNAQNNTGYYIENNFTIVEVSVLYRSSPTKTIQIQTFDDNNAGNRTTIFTFNSTTSVALPNNGNFFSRTVNTDVNGPIGLAAFVDSVNGRANDICMYIKLRKRA